MVAPPPEKLTPELVFHEYAPRIYNLARRMLGNDADAEDVTQDVLLQVVRKLDTFRGDDFGGGTVVTGTGPTGVGAIASLQAFGTAVRELAVAGLLERVEAEPHL